MTFQWFRIKKEVAASIRNANRTPIQKKYCIRSDEDIASKKRGEVLGQ
jgi:hypothetical protein